MSNADDPNLCAKCGHHFVFHDTATGNGKLPAGTKYCDDRYSDPCNCDGFIAKPVAQATTAAPIRMRLFCESCHEQHIDEGEFATKPHHTHQCEGCGLVWRPAIENTVGVRFLWKQSTSAPKRGVDICAGCGSADCFNICCSPSNAYRVKKP